MSTTRGLTFEQTDTLITEDCCNCGVVFAMPQKLRDRLIQTHNSFYCPNGHSQSYTGKTKEQVQRERAERLERDLANKDEDLRAERASHTATKGQLTKAKKRADAGMCQHCNRSYVDVRRHMASKHPDHAVAGLGDGKPVQS